VEFLFTWWFFPSFLPTGDDAVRWCAAPKEGSLAWRLREDGGDVVRTTSLKDLGVLVSGKLT